MEQSVDFVMRARDEASKVFAEVTSGVTSMEAAFSKLAAGGGALGAVAVGLVAVGAAALTASVKLAETVRDLERLSARTGVSVEDLQVFRRVISAAGGDADGIAVALTRFNKAIAEGNPYLKQIGVTSKDTRTAFMQVAEAFANGTDKTKQAAIALSLFGRSGGDFIALLPQIAAHFDDFKKQMEDAGALIHEDVVPGVKSLHDNLVSLSIDWSGALTRIQESTVPWAKAMVRSFLDVWDAVSGKNSSQATLERKITETQERIEQLKGVVSHRWDFADANPLLVALGIGPGRSDKAADDALAEIAMWQEVLTKRQILLSKMTGKREDLYVEGDALAVSAKGGSTDRANPDKGHEDARSRGIDKFAEGFRQMGEDARQARIDATALYDSLQRFDAIAAVRSAQERMSFGPGNAAGIKAFHEDQARAEKEEEARQARISNRFGLPYAQAAPLDAALTAARQQAEQLRAIDEALQNVDMPASERKVFERALTKASLRDFDQSMRDTLRVSSMVRDGLNAVYQGLGQGFDTVAQRMLHRGQTLSSALKTIFDDLVNSIVSMLARLAEAKLFQFAISLIPGLGMAASLNPFDYGGTNADSTLPRGGAFGSSGVTVNISTLDTRGVAQAFGPGGSLRQAFATQARARAY